MDGETKETARQRYKRRPARFWALLALALTVFMSTALYAFVTSPLGDACWVVSVDKYWLREFGDMPGVRAYAEALLPGDQQELRYMIAMSLFPPFYPFFYILPTVGLFTTIALAARRKERWIYAAYVYTFLSVACLYLSPFFLPK